MKLPILNTISYRIQIKKLNKIRMKMIEIYQPIEQSMKQILPNSCVGSFNFD